MSRSRRHDENATAVDELCKRCQLLIPDTGTIALYVQVRRDIERLRTVPKTVEKRQGFGHDLWIVAFCLQHEMPLLTNDSLFRDVVGLNVVTW